MEKPLITIIVPSLNQGQFLDTALDSIFSQDVVKEVFVLDGGSTDNSVDVINNWKSQLAGWRIGKDNGQAAAINEGVAMGSAKYVCWLNSDDLIYEDGLAKLLNALESSNAPVAYGKCNHIDECGSSVAPYLTLPFNQWLLANYCFIGQPATLIRREIWDAVGGLNPDLNFALDYELWWKCFRLAGPFAYVRTLVAANRLHKDTKTHNNLDAHYQESIDVVKQFYGKVPLKWQVMKPIMKLVRRAAALRYAQ